MIMYGSLGAYVCPGGRISVICNCIWSVITTNYVIHFRLLFENLFNDACFVGIPFLCPLMIYGSNNRTNFITFNNKQHCHISFLTSISVPYFIYCLLHLTEVPIT